ncbi:c-type cytochrome [Roseobacter sp. YSTF-M11]|uniref:C-type cytochrome n=1 Tax=Roseobacter insulae TaxID=2859783 RepID=A0A9X1JXW5_9RHOB|nr:c-type cytochrome [Roseobacter insulae]MBW4707581.1 c-type cytochrome [Roseobacter insulae]
MVRFLTIAMVVTASVGACDRAFGDRSAKGAVLFSENCAVCHGADARGGGGAGVAGLSKTPPDLTVLAADNGGEFPLGETLATLEGYADGGLRGRQMVPFNDLASDDKRRVRLERGRARVARPLADLMQYLRDVQRP